MLASVLRVTGDRREDWTIANASSGERYTAGIKQNKEGDRVGFANMMYTRVFYPDGAGDTEMTQGSLNAVLSLEREVIDNATEIAIARS